jgi:Xaa-Pro aminopeptidase
MQQPYRARREKALEAFRGAAAVIPSARVQARNADTDYPFRQNSDFFYLTGFDEPDAVLVLAPEHAEHKSVLFLRKLDRTKEIWNGRRLGVELAVERLGVDAAFPIDEFADRLPEYLVGAKTLHYTLGNDETADRTIHQAIATARTRTRQRGHAPEAIADPAAVVHAMRAIKSEAEIAALRRAAEITRTGHVAAMRATRPGLYEYELQAVMEYEYRRAGARGLAYESIVAAGDNATILHYVTNRDRLEPGALLLVDSGCEFDYYASDVTRTWPVDGRFTPEQRAIYDIVLAAQQAACAQVRPGIPRNAFHDVAIRTIVAGLIDLGLLAGSVDENVETERYRDYYMHGTGHWLGLDVHDAGRYRDDDDKPIVFAPGMVTTVEPGIYVHRDLECDARFKGIGVRIEDDLLVTADGHENLTDAIPKRVEDLEAIVGSGASVNA